MTQEQLAALSDRGGGQGPQMLLVGDGQQCTLILAHPAGGVREPSERQWIIHEDGLHSAREFELPTPGAIHHEVEIARS